MRRGFPAPAQRDPIPHLPKRRFAFRLGTDYRSRILEAPMHPFGLTGEYGATLRRVVADSHDESEILSEKLVD